MAGEINPVEEASRHKVHESAVGIPAANIGLLAKGVRGQKQGRSCKPEQPHDRMR
jgi:hypothetical protein